MRLAGVDDAPSLGRLLHAFNTEFDRPVPEVAQLGTRFAGLLAGDDVLAVIACDTTGDGDDVGFGLITLRPTPYRDGPLAQLEELYVRPDQRSRGIGTALIYRARSECAARGAREIHLIVATEDADARRFYARHGFSGSDPDSGSDLLCYLRQL
ncbi:N-acetyltransferase family protein [Dietzia sp. 179-F 9C3 NHS]|uniref:N-acetyltransferase family protein n=1 Tax=Dietzia sp. 179-F 9C3 NHS TaxID=3374295 RepID=UPI00387A4A77